jgi:hypothetical protein
MAKINIEIDTESGRKEEQLEGGFQSKGSFHLLSSPSQVGLLSSIPITDDMLQYFKLGLGGAPTVLANQGYMPVNIKGGKDQLRGNCKVIATVGGLVVFNALYQEPNPKMPPFVSLLGNVPTTALGNCRGGVSLESVATDKRRKDYLKALPGGVFTDANIYLYANNNATMYNAEQVAWNSNGTFITSYVGDGAGNNNAANFNLDFNGDGGANAARIPNATPAAIIVSDDPFFQANQATLVPLLNTWVQAANTNRRIIYSSQAYNGLAGNSTIIGPDLLKAYMVLGLLAGRLLGDTTTNFGWIKVGSEVI